MAIKDVILDSLFNEFVEQYQIETLKESDAFEMFVNFCIASSKLSQETINMDLMDEIHIGEGNDWGIDGIIILVNDRPVNTIDEINNIVNLGMSMRVAIYLIQSKTSSSIDVGELHKFLNGSRNILKYINGDNNLPPANENLLQKLEVIKTIYRYGSKFSQEAEHRLPLLTLYYAHTGNSAGDSNHLVAIEDNTQLLDNENLTLGNKCEILTASRLRELYGAVKRHSEETVRVEAVVPLPEVHGIAESYLCLLKFSEFRKLLESPDGGIAGGIFEDNVRDYQGENPVNSAIAKTIKDGEINLFTALNNGLTIMCRAIKNQGKSLILTDYQVVNGCQTCHVLYNNRSVSGIDDLMLMAKVISSTDRMIRDKIIVANNNQTEVKREQLTSLLDAQRRIEDYFNYQKKYIELFYERRSKQYKYGETRVPAGKVITITYLIKAFVSMVMGEPHLTSRYYGEILSLYNGENGKIPLFSENTNPAFYYTSALAAYFRDQLLQKGKLPQEFSFIKHHLLQAFPILALRKPIPPLNSNHAQEYCDSLCVILSSTNEAKDVFDRAGKLISEILGRRPERKDLNDEDLSRKIKVFLTRNMSQNSTKDKSSEQKKSLAKQALAGKKRKQ